MDASFSDSPFPSRTDARSLTILTGASRGIGRHLARLLLRRGDTLVCLSRTSSDALAREALAAGTVLEQVRVDLSDPAGAARELETRLDRIAPDAFRCATLINNAGVLPAIQPVASIGLDEIRQALRVGLEAPMALTASFLRATDRWPGCGRRILNVSSGLGRRPMASQATYCAVKAGLDHFTRCLALEEQRRPAGARVAAVAPGVVDTDMQQQMRAAGEQAFPDRDVFVQLKARGQLSSPQVAAEQLLALLEHPSFGEQVILDTSGA